MERRGPRRGHREFWASPGLTGRSLAGSGGGSSDASAIDEWVATHGTKVSSGSSSSGMLRYVSTATAT